MKIRTMQSCIVRFIIQKERHFLVQLLQLTGKVSFDTILLSVIMHRKKEREMKVSKILCVLLIVASVLCLNTVAFAEDVEAPAADCQILGPMGSSDLEGNLLITADNVQMILEADFGTNSMDTLAWDVISGKDVLAIHDRDGYAGQAIATPLADGEAIVIAYLEDGSQASATKKIIVSNQTPETAAAEFTLNCSGEGDGNIKRMTGEESFVMLGTTHVNQYAPGTVMDLIAVENTQPFKYWVVRYGDDKDIIATTEKNFKFVLGQDMKIAAVFDKTDDGTVFGTNFTFLYNNIVANNAYLKSKSKDVPDAPYQRNMSFAKWLSSQVNVDEILADNKLAKGELSETTTFTASYTKNTAECDITVIGGSGSGTYAYGAPVTATVTATAEAGKQFLFWSKDGAPVSYDTTYKFSAMQDCTVAAVFGDAVATDGINMVMQAPVVEGNMIAFTFERYVPESYTFVSSGFVVAENADCKRGDASNLMEAVSYRSGARTQLTKSLTKTSGKTYYARGYVIYMDNGVAKTIYTEPQKIVIE